MSTFYQSLTLLGIGAISGFLSSTPLGPINLWMINASLNKSKKQIFSFLFGVIIADLFYAGIAFWGYFNLIQEVQKTTPIAIFGGLFLITIGILELAKIKGKSNLFSGSSRIVQKSKVIRSFFTGIILCGSNPAFLFFWIAVVSMVDKEFTFSANILNSTFFLLGVFLGDFFWFGVIIPLIRKGLKKAKPAIIKSIQYGIGIIFLGLGIYTIFQNVH